jgi:hypothetical protein
MRLRSEDLQGSDYYHVNPEEQTIEVGLQKIRSKAEEFPDHRHNCILVPLFKKSRLYPTHT